MQYPTLHPHCSVQGSDRDLWPGNHRTARTGG